MEKRLDYLRNAITKLEDNLTLNGNYEYELRELDQIESDAKVEHHLNAETWEIGEILIEVKRLRKWISEEINNR